MSIARFRAQLSPLTAALAGRPLDGTLESWLNREFGADSALVGGLRETCLEGVAQGWLCTREAGGIRYGRVSKPAADLGGFSVDVVDMDRVAGPHHAHPLGEIDLVLPLDGAARFDGQPGAWVVYPPASAHAPTVTGGRALVLYLLPAGRIEFTPAQAA